MLAHPVLARRPERAERGAGEARIHREGLVRRRAHFGEGEGDDGGQVRAAQLLGHAELVPAAVGIGLEGFLEALGRAHDAVLEVAAFLVARLVQRLQHFLAELRAAFEDRGGHVRRQLGEARQVGALVDFQKLMKEKKKILDRGLVARHGERSSSFQ
jgi:hypothetical protein